MGEKLKKLSQITHSWDEVSFGWLAAIVLITAALLYLLHRGLPWFANQLPDRYRFYILPWGPVLRLMILVFAIVQIVPLVIKPTAENLFAILGATAIAVGFAFKDYASSIIAGVVTVFEQPYHVGDWIEVDDVYGEVVSLDMRSLTMVTPDDTLVTVPHSKIWNTAIGNSNSGHREMQCVADFFLHPVHDGDLVRELLWDVGITSPYLQLERPLVVVAAEKPWATHYRLKGYPIDSRDQFLFITDLTIRGKAELTRLGIQFANVPAMAGGE